MNAANSLNISKFDVKQNVDILFIVPPFHMRNGGGSFFPLGLGYIISKVDLSGYSWGVINCSELIKSFYTEDLKKLYSSFKGILLNYNPTVIGVGPCITTQLCALEVISKTCKEVFPNTPVFAGGPLPSIENQEWLFYDQLGIDYLIKGDGELAVVDTIRVLKAGKDISTCKYVSRRGYSYTNFIDDIVSHTCPVSSIEDKCEVFLYYRNLYIYLWLDLFHI